MTGYCRIACLFAIAAHLLQARATNADLPPVSQVPVAERLWTVQIGNGVNPIDPQVFTRVTKICGDNPVMAGPAYFAWLECRVQNMKPVRYRIAALHAAPNESSPVVASVFEEKRADANGFFYDGIPTWTVESSHPSLA